LTTIVSNVQSAAGASSSPASAAGTVATSSATDALQAALQKKISDLLAAGNSLQDIVQQLAAALANTFAGQLSGGTLAQLQSQLQSTFASALAPTGSGPPSSTADLASTLAQRYRQIADLAAGVIGEAGQSNRLFAGSFSDAATTAGGQPAPGSTNGNTAADSTASDASALLAHLTASQGDGKTVATTADLIGTNGDTLLGRILARAQAASSTTSSSTEPATPSAFASATAATNAAASAASSVDKAIAAATAALAQSFPSTAGATTASTATASTATASTAPASAATAVPVDVLASLASKSLAATTATIDAAKVTTAAASAATTPAAASAAATTTPLAPTVSAFVKAFSDALSAESSSVTATGDKAQDGDDDGTATVLPTTVASTQAPTIGAFAPVAPAQTVDPLTANPTSPPLPQQPATTDPNTVVEQVLRGAFLTTSGALSTVRLKLVPDSLGDVSVKLNINGSSVAAQVVAQTPAAHDALVAGQAQLTKSLSDAGLKLTSFNVSLASGGFTSFQQQQQQSAQQQTPSGRQLYLGDVDSSETDDASLAAIPSFAPPATAAPTGWGAYNYLV